MFRVEPDCDGDGIGDFVDCDTSDCGVDPCDVDFDGSGQVDVLDIFAFLTAWFASDPTADFDGMNGVDVPDIFAFLTAWFQTNTFLC